MNACMSPHQRMPPILSSKVKVAISITCMRFPDASFNFMISPRLFVSAARLIAPYRSAPVWLTAGLHSGAEWSRKTAIPAILSRHRQSSPRDTLPPWLRAIPQPSSFSMVHFCWSFPINFQWHVITTCSHLQNSTHITAYTKKKKNKHNKDKYPKSTSHFEKKSC